MLLTISISSLGFTGLAATLTCWFFWSMFPPYLWQSSTATWLLMEGSCNFFFSVPASCPRPDHPPRGAWGEMNIGLTLSYLLPLPPTCLVGTNFSEGWREGGVEEEEQWFSPSETTMGSTPGCLTLLRCSDAASLMGLCESFKILFHMVLYRVKGRVHRFCLPALPQVPSWGFKPPFYCWIALWPWTNYLPSLSISLLSCKQGVMLTILLAAS